uniref:Flavin-containing monooxygenase n=1 Tax=Tyria jacobaeae TaxID=179666 RepID=D6CHF7_TYRJA|nr:flavin-dependent monooxygenase [Tyria jacobaeae]
MGYRTYAILLCFFNWLHGGDTFPQETTTPVMLDCERVTIRLEAPAPLKAVLLPQASLTPRVCIIGAGYSGLATARHMIDYGLNLTVFEASSYIGGTWKYTPRVGTDENGAPLFTSAYKNLRTNSFYQTMEFPDYPFPQGSSSYLSGPCIYKYLQGYTKQFNLEKHIKFQSLVTSVERVGDMWNVTYMKTDTKENVSEECGFVVVANGEYIAPHIPYFAKQEDFQGKMPHSHDYRDSEDYRGLRVLVVGAGPSAFDLATHLINVTSMFIHSHHLDAKLPEVYGNYKRKPDIKHFTPTGAVFVDGSTEEFDVAILCTGYKYSFPFLNYKSSGVAWTDKYVMPLYNQLININYPTMTFVGTGKYSIGLVRDRQGHYSAQLAAGLVKLPSQDEMFKQWFDYTKHQTAKEINLIGYSNTESYMETLLNGTDIPRPPPVFTTILRNHIDIWYTEFLTFRNYQINLLSDTEYEMIYKPQKKVCPLDVQV